MKTSELGAKGEKAAEGYLKNKGYLPLERNWRFGHAEVDLIMEDGRKVVFVEVKLRRGTSSLPRDAVTQRKQALLSRAAIGFMKQRGWLERSARFDVVEVYWQGGEAEIRHFEDAFPLAPGSYYV